MAGRHPNDRGSRSDVSPVPRYRSQSGPFLLSAGFRPFFLAAALWAALAVPLWLAAFTGEAALPTRLLPSVWHVHEMVFGFAAATVAGFLLTAIPNWTGRLPLQGVPLAILVLLWAAGRIAVLASATTGAAVAAALDLAFPLAFLAVVAREVLAGRNWRNLPMIAALGLLLAGNLLVHLDGLGLAATAALGNRIGIATLLMLISLVGGRIIPSFTRNFLAKTRPESTAPAVFDAFDRAALATTALALATWVAAPDGPAAPVLELVSGIALGVRLARWRGAQTLREPLVWILHLGYSWLALGFVLLGLSRFLPALPPSAALHALTAGAIGTMTLAVMTRATLGHSGRPLAAGPGTTTVYALVTVAALFRLLVPFAGNQDLVVLALAGAAWSGAFLLFAVLYLPLFTRAPVGRG
jgi:uncharacterized protein involved in response to NO